MHFDETFWVACAFVSLVLLLFKPLKAIIFELIDRRTSLILQEFTEASRLKKEAESILALASLKKDELQKEVAIILKDAESRATSLLEESEKETKHSIDIRIAGIEERISHLEAKIIEEVHHMSIDIAISVVRMLLKQHMHGEDEEASIKNILNTLNVTFH